MSPAYGTAKSAITTKHYKIPNKLSIFYYFPASRLVCRLRAFVLCCCVDRIDRLIATLLTVLCGAPPQKVYSVPRHLSIDSEPLISMARKLLLTHAIIPLCALTALSHLYSRYCCVLVVRKFVLLYSYDTTFILSLTGFQCLLLIRVNLN